VLDRPGGLGGVRQRSRLDPLLVDSSARCCTGLDRVDPVDGTPDEGSVSEEGGRVLEGSLEERDASEGQELLSFGRLGVSGDGEDGEGVRGGGREERVGVGEGLRGEDERKGEMGLGVMGETAWRTQEDEP
jgi:hypothetical protein